MANFFLAFEQDLAIVPVLNKADLPSADPEATAAQMQQARGLTLIADSHNKHLLLDSYSRLASARLHFACMRLRCAELRAQTWDAGFCSAS